ETRTGLHLCNRGRAGFSLTREGERFYQYVQELFSAMSNFSSNVNLLHTKITGEINIGITDNFVTHEQMIITNMITLLRQKIPGIKVNLQMKPSQEIEIDVINNKYDIGVVQLEKSSPCLEYYPLYHESELLYCAEGHPLFHHGEAITLEEIYQQPAVKSSATQNVDWNNFNISASSADRESTAFLILSGCYIGFLPQFYAQQFVAAGRMRALRHPEMVNEIEYKMIIKRSNINNLIIEYWLKLYQRVTGFTTGGNSRQKLG
uniref:LysR family transcriptional regulator n=1 Tax=Vibrio sp. TaxID=678 RepID=UPI003D0A21D5